MRKMMLNALYGAVLLGSLASTPARAAEEEGGSDHWLVVRCNTDGSYDCGGACSQYCC